MLERGKLWKRAQRWLSFYCLALNHEALSPIHCESGEEAKDRVNGDSFSSGFVLFGPPVQSPRRASAILAFL